MGVESVFTLAHVFSGLNRDEKIQTIKVEGTLRADQIGVRFGRADNFHLFYGDYALTLFNARVTSMSERDVEVVGFRHKGRDFKEWEPITVVLTRPGLGWDYDAQQSEEAEEVTVP